MPTRSAGRVIGRFVPAIWRIPLSNAPTGNPKMLWAAISSRKYLPSGPSHCDARMHCRRKHETASARTSAAGTTVPRMPPITVKNCTSPVASILRTADRSRRLVVFRKHLRGDASPRLGADRRPHLDEPPVKRARRRLVVILDEVDGSAERAGENRQRSERGAGDKRPSGERHRCWRRASAAETSRLAESRDRPSVRPRPAVPAAALCRLSL